jgi:hypothetical protein
MLSRWRTLFRRAQVERELDEELAYHLEQLIAEHRRAGMSADEARAAALRSFGGLEQAKESCRDAHGARPLEDFLRDLVYGMRSLRRSPTFTAMVVLCLAIGIGANVTIFSFYNGVLLRPLPVPDPAQLVRFADGRAGGTSHDERPNPGRVELYSYPLYQRLRDQELVAGHFDGPLAAQQSGTTASQVQRVGAPSDAFDDDAIGRCVSSNFF